MMLSFQLIALFTVAASLLQISLATRTLVVCGSHGTNGGDPPPRQCMKVRPLNDRVLLSSIPVGSCPQIDPPSQQLDTGPPADDEEPIREGQNVRKPDNRRRLPKKLFVGGLNFNEPSFQLEMDMNENTAVWWDHVQEQDDACHHPGRPKSLRLKQVDVIVGDNSIDCTSVSVDQGEVISTNGATFQVRLILKEVLVGRVDLILGTDGDEIRQTVTLHPKTVELYVTNGTSLVSRWQRSDI